MCRQSLTGRHVQECCTASPLCHRPLQFGPARGFVSTTRDGQVQARSTSMCLVSQHIISLVSKGGMEDLCWWPFFLLCPVFLSEWLRYHGKGTMRQVNPAPQLGPVNFWADMQLTLR